jgi:hypothetical protein
MGFRTFGSVALLSVIATVGLLAGIGHGRGAAMRAAPHDERFTCFLAPNERSLRPCAQTVTFVGRGHSKASAGTQVAAGDSNIRIVIQMARVHSRLGDALERGAIEMKMADAVLGLGPPTDEGLEQAPRQEHLSGVVAELDAELDRVLSLVPANIVRKYEHRLDDSTAGIPGTSPAADRKPDIKPASAKPARVIPRIHSAIASRRQRLAGAAIHAVVAIAWLVGSAAMAAETQRAYPRLFGTGETQSDNIKTFPK